MTINSSLRPILDRKQWEMVTPIPVVPAAGSMVVSSLQPDQLQLFVNSTTVQFIYDPSQDSWLQLPSGALSAFAAGSCGTHHPFGPSGTATSGSATTLTTNLTIPGSIAGYKIRITGGTAAGREETIISNTYGTNSVITFASGATIDNTSTYVILSGRFWIFTGTAANGLKYYDVATHTWSAAQSVTGVTAALATDAKIRSTPGLAADFATGTATSATSTTLTVTGKTWTVNQWTNYQVRITGGTGVGQVRIISSNTATALTVPAWTVTPDATSTYVIEGCDDFLYLIGGNAVTMFRYSISGNAWSTVAPAVARAGAPNLGCSLLWVRSNPDSTWTNESAILNGRRLYSFRGGATALLDVYDIPSNSWSVLTYKNQAETFTTGSSFDNGLNGTFYAHKDATSRYFQYSTLKNELRPLAWLPYPQGAALVGDRLFTVDFYDDESRITFLYHVRNSGSEMFRMLLF